MTQNFELQKKALYIPDITLETHVIHELRDLARGSDTSGTLLSALENWPGLGAFRYLRHASFLTINQTKDVISSTEYSIQHQINAMALIHDTQQNWDDPELNASEIMAWKNASEALEAVSGQSLHEFFRFPYTCTWGIVDGTQYGRAAYSFKNRSQWEILYLRRNNRYWNFIEVVELVRDFKSSGDTDEL